MNIKGRFGMFLLSLSSRVERLGLQVLSIDEMWEASTYGMFKERCYLRASAGERFHMRCEQRRAMRCEQRRAELEMDGCEQDLRL